MENHPFLWRRIRRVRRIQVCMARKELRSCPDTLFISHENAKVLFSAFIVRVPDPKRGLEMKFRSESTATFVFLLLWEKTWCWSRIDLLSFSKKCQSWLFERFSVRPSRTWSRRRYALRPAGEAPLGRWNNGDFVQNNAFGHGVMTKTERSATRGFYCHSLTQEHVRHLLPEELREKSSFCSTWRHRQHNSVKKAPEDRRR